MGAGETTEGHSIQPLAGEAGVADAIEVLRCVERHRQQRDIWDRSITALKAPEKTPVAAGVRFRDG